MTREQFALAVNADEKWVENAARLLKHSLGYSQSESRWMGFVRLFNHEMGFPLKRSAELANEAMRHKESTRELRIGLGPSGAAEVVVDLGRFHSAHNAALSAALTLAGPRKRGRPAGGRNKTTSMARERPALETTWDVLARAQDYGVDIDALRNGLNETPAQRLQRLEDNSRFIAEMRQSAISAARKTQSERTGRPK